MRRPRRGDDGGFAMVFVLLVVAMVTVAVASVLTVTTPDISRTKLDQDAQGASAAARAAVDDFIAHLLGIDRCRSTTRVCDDALGAASGVKTLDASVGSTMSWTTDASLTSTELVRVHATGTYGRATRTLDADLRLAPSILSYGYYSDYESQSSASVNRIYQARAIRLDNSGAWGNVTRVSLNQATTVNWAAPANTNVCERHWWSDASTNPVTPARGSSTWSAKASFSSTSATTTPAGGCDVIFATGMTFDGPVYTRDAILVDSSGGSGPIFQQPVLTGWGFTGHNSPAAPALTATTGPWRQNTGNDMLTASPNKPTPARFDLTLPETIGTEDIPSDACVYTGPTRVVLNGDGTATITSPLTTSKAAGANAGCYPGVIGSGGITRFTLSYGKAPWTGGGAILVRNVGTQPSTGWPTTGQRSTTTPSASTSAFWNTATGGTASNGTSAASDSGCSSTVTWSATVNAACAWSETPSYTSTTDGWTSASTTACSTTPYAATNQRQFECEYSNQTSGTPTKTYATFRSAVKTALASSSCAASGSTASQRQQCLVALLGGQLPTATTSVRYVVTPTTGTDVAGTTRALSGAGPAFPQASDPIFANGPTTTGTEAGTNTPVTLVVSRQTSTNGGSTWSGSTPQFKLTVTSTTWNVATPSTATSYFPSVRDVTQYGSSANPTTAAGDLYVQGTNQGKLSLLADNDVVATGDVLNASSNTDADAVNMVAGQFVRNYNPVACVSTNTSSINATSPGYCPNDITNLRSGALTSNGQFTANDATQQYTNLLPAATRTVNAALFALNGSLSSDNYNRGDYMGQLQINGGIYQEHRGVNGYQSGSGSTVARTGYLLQYHYVDQRYSDLPYEPTTKVKSGRVWSVVTVSASGPS